jgi:sulfur carrier protein ThiS
MHTVTLVLVPGPGARTVEVAEGTSLAQFAADHSLNGRQLIVDGEGVPNSQWGSVTLDGASEIFATGSVKGN